MLYILCLSDLSSGNWTGFGKFTKYNNNLADLFVSSEAWEICFSLFRSGQYILLFQNLNFVHKKQRYFQFSLCSWEKIKHLFKLFQFNADDPLGACTGFTNKMKTKAMVQVLGES